MLRYTIRRPNTPEQYVVVCVKCNNPCEFQQNTAAKGCLMTLLAGPIGFMGSAMDSWWRCHACGKAYRDGDFRKGRIQKQKYEGAAMPTYEGAKAEPPDEDPYADYSP